MYKLLKSLKQKKYRDEYGLFTIEGEKFIDEIPNGIHIESFCLSESYAKTHPDFTARSPVTILKDSVFNSVSNNKTPQGRIALCRKPRYRLDEVLNKNSGGLFIIADTVADPSNLGAIVRTSYAAGASGVIISKASAELYSPKTLQAAAGAVFRLPIIENADIGQIIRVLREKGVGVIAACPKARTNLYEADLTKPIAVIIGNESNGVSEDVLSQTDDTVFIPMPGGLQSLNVSAALSVIVFEAVRQRAGTHTDRSGQKPPSQ